MPSLIDRACRWIVRKGTPKREGLDLSEQSISEYRKAIAVCEDATTENTRRLVSAICSRGADAMSSGPSVE
jgi:hypothetical protein